MQIQMMNKYGYFRWTFFIDKTDKDERPLHPLHPTTSGLPLPVICVCACVHTYIHTYIKVNCENIYNTI